MVASRAPHVKIIAPSAPSTSFTPPIPTRLDTWFTRAVFAFAAGVFLFNLIRFLASQP